MTQYGAGHKKFFLVNSNLKNIEGVWGWYVSPLPPPPFLFRGPIFVRRVPISLKDGSRPPTTRSNLVRESLNMFDCWLECGGPRQFIVSKSMIVLQTSKEF